MTKAPAITEADIFAVLAVQAGTANADQQKHCMKWILTEGCRYLAVAPETASDREAAIHEGRRTVGLLITQMGDPGVLKAARDNAKRGKP